MQWGADFFWLPHLLMDTQIVIIGGGLAGLVAALELVNADFDVLLIEKKGYPRHKVCGEYVSNEVRAYLENLGLDLVKLGVKEISQLVLTSPTGFTLEAPLPMGGFGVSRFRLEDALYQLCVQAGVRFLLHTSVGEVINYSNQYFEVVTQSGERISTDKVIGAFGKKSGLDVKMGRAFVAAEAPYMAVKYHIRYDHPEDTIYLHNFKEGYCGMSAIEEGKSCLCYLTHRSNIRKAGGAISQLEQTVLRRNPHLSKIFSEAEFLYEKPMVISGFNFRKKKIVENDILMVGDAAGLIPPLCGNGMAMAIDGARLLAHQVIRNPKASVGEIANQYQRQWNRSYSTRLRIGRSVQASFGREWVTDGLLRFFALSPSLTQKVIRLTHGDEVVSKIY